MKVSSTPGCVVGGLGAILYGSPVPFLLIHVAFSWCMCLWL